jgi:IclR family KDG regulon transcriptional repressor
MGRRSKYSNRTESKSVVRAVQIIEYLSLSSDQPSIRSMARALGCGASTLHRYLATYKGLGYVRQNQVTGRYELTLKFAWLASKVMENLEVSQAGHPLMEDLTRITGQTTHLAVLENEEMVYVAKIDGNEAVNMRSRIGSRAFVHSTAAGKAMLAFLSRERRREIVQRLKLVQLTPRTVVSKQQLSHELDLIAKRGYAIDDEENEVGIRCVGAPILDIAGEVAGGLSISGWTLTMTLERAHALAPEVVRVAQLISRELGWYPSGGPGR